MERLSYIELLCLRVSDGMGTERDIKRLERAGIDPQAWTGLRDVLRAALAPPPAPEISGQVCEALELPALPLQAALSPQHIPSLVPGVSKGIGLEVDEETAPLDPILTSPEISLEKEVEEPIVAEEPVVAQEPEEPIVAEEEEVVEQEPEAPVLVEEPQAVEPEITEELLAQQEADATLRSALAPASIPNLLDGIMSQIQPVEAVLEDSQDAVLEEDSGEIVLEEDSGEIVMEEEPEVVEVEEEPDTVLTLVQVEEAELDEDDDSDEVFVLQTNSIIAEPEMEASDLEEDDLETLLQKALVTPEAPDMSDWIMQRVEEIGVPETHLRLVDEDQQEATNNAIYKERVGEVDVEIQEIAEPRLIDGDSAAGNWSMIGMLVLAAAAAIFVVNQVIGESPYEKSGVVTNPEIAQGTETLGTEILNVVSDDHIQIQSDGSMTIIFIDVGEE